MSSSPSKGLFLQEVSGLTTSCRRTVAGQQLISTAFPHWSTSSCVRQRMIACPSRSGTMELLDYVSREELERRWVRIRGLMDCDALVVLQNVDQFYLTGT